MAHFYQNPSLDNEARAAYNNDARSAYSNEARGAFNNEARGGYNNDVRGTYNNEARAAFNPTQCDDSSVSSSSFDVDEYVKHVTANIIEPCIKQEPDSPDGAYGYPVYMDEEPSSPEPSWCPEEQKSSLRYPPCVVCGGKTSGLHYGCYTCEACKNFFRRYLMRNEPFHCKKGGDCKIVNKNRGNCSGCRLQKCLQVGMAKEKSKIGRYTHSQRTETINEVKKLEGKLKMNSSDPSVNSLAESFVKTEMDDTPVDMTMNAGVEHNIPQTDSHELVLQQSDAELVCDLVEAMDAIEHFGEHGKTPEGIRKLIEDHYQKYLAKVKLFGPLKAIPKEEYFTLLKMYNIDLDQRWDLFKREANNCNHIVKRYCEFAYHIPGFKDFDSRDQENLLKFGHCEFFLILLHQGYMDEYKIFLEMNGVPSHIEEAADKIFSRTLVEMQCELSVKWQRLNLSKEEIAVLIAMSLVSTDRCELVNFEPIDKAHSNLSNLLCKVLFNQCGKDWQKKFSKIVDCLMASRQGSELYFKEYTEMSKNQMITDAAPNFPALCPEIPD